jgi:hypothetical protein
MESRDLMAFHHVERSGRPGRAGQRGAAMVEGLVAIPVFMVIFASAVYIQDLYSTKLETMANSRESAWENASDKCEQSEKAKSPPVPEPKQTDLAAGQEAPGGLLCDSEFKESVKEINVDVKMSDYMGGDVSQVGAGTRILCNEQPVPGDFKKGIDYLWQKYGAPTSTIKTKTKKSKKSGG